MQSIGCILCNTEPGRDKPVIEENGWSGLRCEDCGLIYISPRPELSEIINLYGHDDAHLTAASHLSRGAHLVRQEKKSFLLKIGKGLKNTLPARHTLSILRRWKANGSLLEIGAGGGVFLHEARKKGFEVYGIDANGKQAAFIADDLKIPCEKSSLASAFPGRQFDVIYHCDVLSHFYDPVAEFKEMHRRLKNNGVLIFETGNFGDVLKRYYSAIWRFQYPDHLFFFGEKSLVNLLRATGFELLEMRRYSVLLQYRLAQRRRVRREREEAYAQARDDTKPGRSIVSKILRRLHAIYAAARLYVVRYKLGSLLPKHGRPQTVIVVARKS